MSYIPIGFDELGVIAFENCGQKVYNPFEVALQAMIGEKVMLAYSNPTGNLIPRYYPIRYLPDPSGNCLAKSAMKWILDNEVREGVCGYWNYNYDCNYAGELIKGPWRSSFGQAYISLAALLWFKHTNSCEYKELALRAINGLVTPIAAGGTAVFIEEGTWYEEIPSGKPTHIFNAQLMSLIALAEASRLVENEQLTFWLEKGMLAFLEYSDNMDTGNWSAYDIPQMIDVILQLVLKDAGKLIKIRKISLYSDEKRIDINLGSDDGFIQGLQWAAGIDWGKVDSDGYRELFYGPAIHPVPVPTGDRQNSFLYFKDVSVQRRLISLCFEYSAEYETELQLFRVDSTGNYFPLGFSNSVPILPGYHKANIHIPSKALGPPLSEVYHWFHILLLEELYQLKPESKLAGLSKRYRGYAEKIKGVRQKTPLPTELQSIYVSVNNKCGLSCKMCDLGSRNKSASLYKNLIPSEKPMELDSELLLFRCRETIDTLKRVHFIGTEPTLYPKLPELTYQLKKMGLKVAVTTNGIKLAEALPKLLISDIDEIWVSIDGPLTIHDEIRGKEGLFNGILNALYENKKAILRKKLTGLTLYAACAITPMNYMFLRDLVRDTEGVPIDCYWLTHMNYVTEEIAEIHRSMVAEYPISASSCTHSEMNPSLVNPYVLWASIHDALNTANQIGRKLIVVPKLDNFIQLEDFYKRPGISLGKPRCDVALTSMEINCDGSTCVMARCYQFDIGNVYEKSLNELFFSMPLIKFRKELLSQGLWGPCLRCCGIME